MAAEVSQAFGKSEVTFRSAVPFACLLLDPAFQAFGRYKKSLANMNSGKSFHLYDLIHLCTTYTEDIGCFGNAESQFSHVDLAILSFSARRTRQHPALI